MPPFQAALNVDALLEGAGVILRQADPAEPGEVSQTGFNDHRDAVPGIPTARVVCKRLDLSWEDAKRVALAQPGQRSRLLGVLTRRAEQPVTEAEIAHALRTVAAALDQSTLRPHEYEQVREQAQDRSRRAWRHGRPEGPLPSLNQIRGTATWDEALAVAGLQPLPSLLRTGEDPVEMAVSFIDTFECVPSYRQFQQWIRSSDVALADNSRQWSLIQAEAIAARAAAGKPACSKCARKLITDVEMGAPRAEGMPRARNAWTRQMIIEGVAIALDDLPAGERLTLRVLGRFSTGRPEIPAPSKLSSHGISLEDATREAEKLR